MPQRRHRPEEIIAKLREADVLLGQGRKVAEVVRALGVSLNFSQAVGASGL